MFKRNGRLLKVVVVFGLALTMIQATPAGAATAVGIAAPGVLGGCGDGTCGYVVK